MTFSELSLYFEKLESTSSRLALIDILSDLFKHADIDELDKIIYLTQGRIAPFFAALEIGMADKTVASALALAYDSSKEEVLKLYGKFGDMGLVAMQLNQKSKIKNQKLSVSEVFDIFTQIAKTSGEGTVEKRQQLLSELLKKLDPVSAKHLVRVPLGASRLGIGDPTVLDGLAIAFLGDKSKRKLLEKAYNETSDLGLIAKTLKSGGLQEVGRLQVTVGRPIRSELCERLPNPQKVFEKMASAIGRHSGNQAKPEHPGSLRTIRDAGQARLADSPRLRLVEAGASAKRASMTNSGVHATPKYDGFRVQIHKNGEQVRMFSRNLEEMTHMFPELTKGALKQVKAHSVILDTEALAYNTESEEFLPFQETTKRRRKHNIEELAKKLPLRAFVFDILYIDGKSLLDTPLIERMEILKKTVLPDETLIPSPGKILHNPKDLQMLLDDSISKGLEGVVVKRVDSLYEAGGRNFNWVKLKRHSAGELNDTIDCVILGYIFGKGKRTAFGAGALLVGVYDSVKDEFVTVSKIGTGLTDEEWREIKVKSSKLKVQSKPARVNSLIEPSQWVEPKIVIEVLADEITRSPIHTAGSKVSESGEKEPGYALRFPRLVSFRTEDRKAEDATTVKELIHMFEQQGKK